MKQKSNMRHLWRALAAVVGAILGIAIYLGAEQLTGNFHTVLPGELYRSAQLKPGDLARYEQLYHIRSVINLRGANPKEAWYRNEVQEAAALGVQHMDFRMSASRELTSDEAIALIALMKDAPKPLLIHCRSGADRTGLAAAFYVAGIAHHGEWAAEEQLWIENGHVPLWFTKAFAMNRTFERMEPYLGFDHS